MPRKPQTYNRADVKAQVELFESMGKIVTAIKYHPDGTFRIMTKDHKSYPDAGKVNPWDEVLAP